MTPKLEAIFKKHPLPWTKHGVDVRAYKYILRDARADRVFCSSVHHHDVDTILALANAHAPVERERYTVRQDRGDCRFWYVVDEEHETAGNYAGTFTRKEAEQDAHDFAARSNAKEFIDRRDSMAVAEEAAARNAESAPPEPGRSRTPTFEEMHRQCGPPPSETPHDPTPISKEFGKRVVGEPEVPERPWRFDDTQGNWIYALSSPDAETNQIELSEQRGALNDIGWAERKANLRRAVRCVNAEPKNERVWKLARELVGWILGPDAACLPKLIAKRAKQLQTELEKTDGQH